MAEITQAEAFLQSIHDKSETIAKQAADDFYERFLYDVQGYLIDNATFNIGSTISMHENEAKRARAEVVELRAENEKLREALGRIERWHGEFPDTGEKWQDGTPISYEAQWGSNGARDYMRSIARTALAGSTLYRERIAALEDALRDHNDLLRSAFQAAQRDAINDTKGTTNYRTLADRASEVLSKHHAVTAALQEQQA